MRSHPRDARESKLSDITMLGRHSGESVLDYSVRLAWLHRETYDVNVRKPKGQVFTPETVSRFMANLINVETDQIRLLEPGAGTGTLVAAFCDHLMNNVESGIHLIVDAYENDPAILPKLRATLEECQAVLELHGHRMEYNIYDVDFILCNAGYFRKPLLVASNDQVLYDVVIANPPYYKLNKDSPQAKAMQGLIYGQPNIYALFMALAVCMLRKDGQAVFITPRSFCSGLYYKRFREWLLNESILTHIHLFESRVGIFDDDDVLQENVILRAVKAPQNRVRPGGHITVSVSEDKTFQGFQTFDLQYSQVVFRTEADIYIRIPSSPTDLQVLRIVDSWPNTLHSLGLEISTGPVVPFRAREHLCHKHGKDNVAPLLWMHNIQGWEVKWPANKNDKEQFIRISEEARRLLLPTRNYVLLKRFSSKEQKRRLYAAVLLQSNFRQHTVIGVENHLNYVHRPKGILSEDEAYGLAAILNTLLIDIYFRSLNGNTQVNASDIRILPLPSTDAIRKIGTYVQQKKPTIGSELDRVVARMLELDLNMIDELELRVYGHE